MSFRQEADEYEIWYSETNDPNEDLKMLTMNKWKAIRELSWWFTNVKDKHPDAKIHIIREHF